MLREGMEDPSTSTTDLDSYGVDPDRPVPDVHQEVVVPETLCPLSDSDQQNFLDGLMQLEDEHHSDYGLHKFQEAKALLSNIMQEYSSNSDIDD